MNNQDIEDYYDGIVDEWVIDTKREPRKYIYNKYFHELFLDVSGKRALDLGCGAGTFTLELAKRFDEVWAVDLSEEMLNRLKIRAKQLGLNNIKTLKSDVDKLDFKDSYFDFAMSMGLMECLKQPVPSLIELNRVLKPSGIARVRWLNKGSLWSGFETMKRLLRFPTGPFAQNAQNICEINRVIGLAGMKIKSTTEMIKMPVFMFPHVLGRIATFILVKSGFSYYIEKKQSRFLSYSFLLELGK